MFLNPVYKIIVSEFGLQEVMYYLCHVVLFSSIMSCLYHLRSPSRETIGVVSIGTWAEKELSN